MAHLRDYQVRWTNFRGFQDTGWVSLPPLTVLLGVNNVGKTSFIAPLLLMAQTLESEDAASAIVSRGKLLDAGHFADLAHGGAKEVSFGFRFHAHDRDEEHITKLGDYPPGAIEVTLIPDDSVPSGVGLSKYSIFDLHGRRFLSLSRSGAKRYRLSGYKKTRMRPEERRALRYYGPFNFLFSPTRLTRGLGPRGRGVDLPMGRGRYSAEFSQLLTVIGYTYTEVREIMNRFSYIGPLRERPMRYYEVPGSRPSSIGSRGEQAPYLLRARSASVKPDVDRWIAKFELGDRVRIVRHFEDIFSLMLEGKAYRRPRNIADLGFGISQLFPLIVQAAAALRGSLTVAEQPEIHLNPKLQCLLADLFTDMATSGKRVIVETHSEHFLLRLRRLIADEKIKVGDVGLYFIEKQGRNSTIRRVRIDDIGHIKDKEWPEGFFGETLRESLGLAEAQAKANQRKRRRAR
jgi:predicted ATPase